MVLCQRQLLVPPASDSRKAGTVSNSDLLAWTHAAAHWSHSLHPCCSNRLAQPGWDHNGFDCRGDDGLALLNRPELLGAPQL
jgi:hypothetical protein